MSTVEVGVDWAKGEHGGYIGMSKLSTQLPLFPSHRRIPSTILYERFTRAY
jgi:hypothetical protein